MADDEDTYTCTVCGQECTLEGDVPAHWCDECDAVCCNTCIVMPGEGETICPDHHRERTGYEGPLHHT